MLFGHMLVWCFATGSGDLAFWDLAFWDLGMCLLSWFSVPGSHLGPWVLGSLGPRLANLELVWGSGVLALG